MNPSGQIRRSFWLRTMIHWHWISSAICLIAMIGFSATGITLNHASQISVEPSIDNLNRSIPAAFRYDSFPDTPPENAPLPAELAAWLSTELAVSIGSQPAEWSEDEIYLSLPRPGGDAWLSIDRASGDLEFERTDRGWISYFNDLHKGRNTGPAWSWFLDVFAIATLVFCFTGLGLLFLHARQRKWTWPLIGLGLVIPLLLAFLFIH